MPPCVCIGMGLVITPIEIPRRFNPLSQPLATSQKLGGRELVWRFDGGDITSDGDRHGTGNPADRDSETIQPPLSAAGNLAEIGRTPTGLALRWGRHPLRWGSVAVAETGGAHGNRTAVRRLLHRLPQPQADRTSVVGPDHAARVRAGAGLRGSQ